MGIAAAGWLVTKEENINQPIYKSCSHLASKISQLLLYSTEVVNYSMA